MRLEAGCVLAVLACIGISVISAYAPTTMPPQNICDPAPYECDPTTCIPPACKCSGSGSNVLTTADRPQIIYLTYDDGLVAYAESNFFRGLFDGTYKNPDGNPIRATFFLTHLNNDYTLVNQYYRMGHEMADHSITHRTDLNYWKGLNIDGWMEEVLGMRKMITQFANIPAEEIKGFRSPFLQMGGDEMYATLYNLSMYDCSWASRDYGYLNLGKGLYPYTMDYRSFQDCEIEPCPQCSYPGMWVQPMLDLEDNWFGSTSDPNTGSPCSMLDGCIFIDPSSDAEDVKNMLWRNFMRNRNGTRAPMGLYMHAGWFYGEQEWHYDGYKMFIEEALKMGDVWFVPVIEGLNYVANFTSMTNADILGMGDTSPFSLKQYEYRQDAARDCEDKSPCQYRVINNPDIYNGTEVYMHICGKTTSGFIQNCPSEFPWLGNPCGGNYPCQ